MPAIIKLMNATVLRAESREYKPGKSLISAFVQTWRKTGNDKMGKPAFEDLKTTVTIFNPGDLRLDKDDKVNIEGQFRLDSNPEWVLIKKDDIGNKNAKSRDSSFHEVIAFAEGVEILTKGDRTAKEADDQAREKEPTFAHNDNDIDDDLPF